MSSIFAPTDGTCGIFAPTYGPCNAGTQRVIAFARPAVTQNTSGEVVQTFVPTLALTGDYQPKPAGFQRLVLGQVVEVKSVFIVMGYAQVLEGYRCYVDGMQLEIVNVLRYGNEHTEIEFQQIGR